MPFLAGDSAFLPENRTTFDFNIEFEQLFLSILPSALFILTSVWRIYAQIRRPTVVNAPVFKFVKVGTIITYAGFEMALLVLAVMGSVRVSTLFLAASALRLVSAFFVVAVSVVDHDKSVRPSVLLSSYLTLTVLLDIAQARTLFLISEGERPEMTYSALFCVGLAVKFGILLLEARQKTRANPWDEKQHSPEETSSLFSLGVFFWLNSLFATGYRNVLGLSDLYALDTALDARKLHESFVCHRDYADMRKDSSSLLKSLIRTLWSTALFPVLPRLALLGFTFCQPLFIEKLLQHLAQPEIDANIGSGLIGASVLIYMGIAISAALYNYLHRRMLAMLRSILVTEIYERATQARSSHGDDDAGQDSALTLMSTDIERIDLGLQLMHDVWASLLQAGLAGWMLYRQLGLVFVTSIGIVSICFVALAVLMSLTGDSQREWMAQVQTRVGLTASVVANMKNLKLSGLALVISDFVQDMRVTELAAGVRFRKIFIWAAIFGYIPMFFSPPVTLAFAQTTLDSTTMFTSLSYLLLLAGPLSEVFQIVPQLLAAVACIGRIQTFLGQQAADDYRQAKCTGTHHNTVGQPCRYLLLDDSDKKAGRSDDPALLVAEDATFGWQAAQDVLRNLNMSLHRGTLTLAIGPVGAGKSSLCKALLGEMPYIMSGSVTLHTAARHVGYCDQTPFLCNGSLRDNIIGFSTFDAERYATVIRATALDFDLKTLPRGDSTNIGSSGITLSGGQKQRISLARALYLQTDLLVLDDVLTGLDADTEEQVFDRVFGPEGLLKQRQSAVLLCTHSIRHLPAADHIIVLDKGAVAEEGDFESLVARCGYVHGLGLTQHRLAKSKPAPSVSFQTSPAPLIPTGAVESNTYKEAFDAKDDTAFKDNAPDDVARQLGDKTVYMHYARSMGIAVAIASVIFATGWGFFTSFPTIWLKFWSDDMTSENPVRSYAFYAGMYAMLQALAMVSLLLLGITIFIVSVKRAGANLHKTTLDTLVRAPLVFFSNTDTGVITNLFSQDLNLVDTELPNMLLNVLFVISQAIGAAIIMLTASPYMGASYPFLLVLLYFVQKFYLRTSRQLRLLDLETKSPLYTHFIDTVKGLATLRAFGFIREDINKNIQLLNSSQRPAYLLVMIQQWLNLVLNLVVMVMAAILTTMAVKLHSNSGFTGAALVSLMTFGEKLSGIVIFYTRLETSIGAVARLKSFQDKVSPEDREGEHLRPPIEWPQHGAIELRGASAGYETVGIVPERPKLALENLVLSIKPGEKVAICGRTGSGKSSLVALLLKLLDPVPGLSDVVLIDDIPLTQIERETLRQRIIVVPQEAVFLPDGTSFKLNLDPTSTSSVGECEAVLTDVGLLDFVQRRGGLLGAMNASVLSAGQRQLLSLGRAVLRRRIRSAQLEMAGRTGSEGGILLLDECSSSVDHETERTMLDIIKAEFASYTIVAVSHRLDMIMDFDRVVVMDTGSIVEVGRPGVLAGEASSRFGELVSASAK